MIRATTPTHTFEFSMPSEEFDKIQITYKQGDDIKLVITEKELELAGNFAIYKFSENDTKLFTPNKMVLLQVRCAKDGSVITSPIMSMKVIDVLNDENLLEE